MSGLNTSMFLLPWGFIVHEGLSLLAPGSSLITPVVRALMSLFYLKLFMNGLAISLKIEMPKYITEQQMLNQERSMSAHTDLYFIATKLHGCYVAYCGYIISYFYGITHILGNDLMWNMAYKAWIYFRMSYTIFKIFPWLSCISYHLQSFVNSIDFSQFIIGFSWPYQCTCTHICDDYWLEANQDTGSSFMPVVNGSMEWAYFTEMLELCHSNGDIIHSTPCFT